MAIIYSYPDKANPSLLDKLIINDVESSPVANETKRITIQALADSISGQFTLQEVLQAGDSAIGSTGNAWEGDMSLTQQGNFVAPIVARRWIVDLNGTTGTANNKTAYLVGDMEIVTNGAAERGGIKMTGDLYVGGDETVIGDLTMNTASSDIIMSDGKIQADVNTSLNFDVQTPAEAFNFTGAGVEFLAGTVARLGRVAFETDNAFYVNAPDPGAGYVTFNAGHDFGVSAAVNITLDADNTASIFADNNTLVCTKGGTNSTVNIGGTTGSNRAGGVFVQAENFYQTRTNTGQGKFYIIGGPQPATDSDFINSVHPHTFMDEIRLGGTAATFNETGGTKLTPGTKGDAGTAGDLLSSQGPGSAPQWVSSSSLSVGQVIEDVQFASAVIKGTAVYISGPAHGSGRPTVDIADAFIALPQMPAIGLALEDYPAGQGKVIITGVLDIDLTTHGTFGVGNVLYVKDQGGAALNTNLQNTKPTGNAKIQNVGIVAKSGANGAIQVSCIGRINDLPQFDAPNAFWAADSNNTATATTGNVEFNGAQQTFSLLSFYKIDASSPVGTANTFIGSDAAQSAYDTGGTPTNSVYIGNRAGQGKVGANNDSTFNIAIGSQTLAGNNNTVVTDPLRNTSSSNVAIGHQVLSQPGGGAPTAPAGSRVGSGNVCIGYQATPSAYDGGAANEGENNVFIGNSAGFNLTTGYRNVGVGANVLNNLTTGDRNVGIGGGGTATGSVVTTGSANVLIGDRANVTAGGDNAAVAIGIQSTAAGSGIAIGQTATANGAGVSIGLGAGTAPSGSVGQSIVIGAVNGSGTNNGIVIGNQAEVGAHQEAVAIGTGAKTAVAHDIALGGIDMIGPATGVGAGGTLGIGVRQAGVPVAGGFQSQPPIAQIPVKFPDGAGNLVTGFIYIYP